MARAKGDCASRGRRRVCTQTVRVHPSAQRGVHRPGARWTSFLGVLYQPRLISLASGVPCRLFNDNCILLICQPLIKVFPGERQRKKRSNLFIRGTNYPNWTLRLHVVALPFRGVRAGWLRRASERTLGRIMGTFPLHGGTCSKLFTLWGLVSG